MTECLDVVAATADLTPRPAVVEQHRHVPQVRRPHRRPGPHGPMRSEPHRQEDRMNLADQLAHLTGRRTPGGCDDCDAHQTFDTSDAPVIHVNVHHDVTCPALRGAGR